MANEFDNFDKKNLKSVSRHIEEDSIPEKVYTMIVDESGNGDKVKVSEESRKKSVYERNKGACPENIFGTGRCRKEIRKRKIEHITCRRVCERYLKSF